ncbi:hypothetical protein BDZ94DRAFT_1235454 [Collybia nuda]|uniref:Uncharacterized protein n=1 Tax=Collybia nuda TaxID=64659 RepID=A0A9P5Y8S0_9AGAR|nr:hypothetical protein BDZ94DRAFT_1235454 [Collybia nuda]
MSSHSASSSPLLQMATPSSDCSWIQQGQQTDEPVFNESYPFTGLPVSYRFPSCISPGPNIDPLFPPPYPSQISDIRTISKSYEGMRQGLYEEVKKEHCEEARNLKRKRGPENEGNMQGTRSKLIKEREAFFRRTDAVLTIVARIQGDMVRFITSSDQLLKEISAILREMH